MKRRRRRGLKSAAKRRTLRRGTRCNPRGPKRWRQGGINRREFLAYTAGAGILLGASPFLKGCGGDDDGGKNSGNGGATEERTYVFDLSYMDTSQHDVILVAGTDRPTLDRVTDDMMADLRSKYPLLELVPGANITHCITRQWPADAIQLCYLQRVSHGTTDGSWDMSLMFYHLPISAVMDAAARRQAMAEYRDTVPVKWAQYGLTASLRQQLDDPVGEDSFKDPCDQATSLVVAHPELTCGDPCSAAHIQTNIVGTQSSTQILAQSLCAQGPATTSGGWATLNTLINPDTNQPAYNSMGQIQQMPVWSDETQMFAGQAISPGLTTAKNDTTLGSNITDIDPESITGGDPSEPTNGAVWTLQDGMPSVDQSDANAQLMSGSSTRPAQVSDSTSFMYQLTNQSPDKGYSAKVVTIDEDRNVTVQLKNWYVRYLGFYVRYLDANGNPISLSTIEDTLKSSGHFPLYDLGLNGEYDAFVDLINPEWVIYGIPVQSTTVMRTFPLPEEATAVEILCSGFGSGSNPYPDTLDPGKITTIVIDIALPSLFLALAAAAGITRFTAALQTTSVLIQQLQILVQLFQATFLDLTYDNPTALIRVGVSIAQQLLKQLAGPLDELIAESIAEGEAEEAVEDAIPIVGTALAAISALGLAAQLAETSAEVATSPNTYATKLNFTHDVQVTIKHDPDDPEGFPATATHFIVTASFDQGTPYTITMELPGTTVTDPQVVTFMSVPFGGMVTVNVGFYSDSGWLAGNGSVGPVDNVSDNGALALEITIMENLVPLESDTVYSQKEIIVLDSQGNHQWEASTTPPAITSVQGECESANGQLCSLTGITVSTINAAVGYTWQSYNSQVMNCDGGSAAQLHQFANISVTQNPQSEYLFPGCGFSGTARIAYDLLGKMDYNFYLDPTDNKNLIRQIRLSGGSADFDGPNSNKAWGRFKFASSAMLLHPAGRVISINSSANKIEVVQLPGAAVADADAPQATVYSGTGIREGLMNGPTLAALTPDGTILVLETKNNRIQAFDLGANPVPMFMEDAYYVPLVDQPTGYLDLAVEYTGFMYVLSYTGTTGSLVFRLDIYTPEGEFLARTTGFDAGKVAVNYWRDLFALNYQVLKLPNGSLPARTEPSVSHWIPSTPSASV